MRSRGGLTSGEIAALLPQMSRFGVMKHLKVLEEANLISTRKAGRFKHHYLNPVPFQQIADHFVSRFAAPWTRGMIDLKTDLEARNVMAAPKHVMVTVIHTTPEALWEALTTPAMSQKYFFGFKVGELAEGRQSHLHRQGGQSPDFRQGGRGRPSPQARLHLCRRPARGWHARSGDPRRLPHRADGPPVQTDPGA